MTTQARSSKPGPRRTLTESAILEAALDLLDEGGVHAASVRGIAARVGVAPNAVYTYFPDKAAVVKAIVEHLLGQVDLAVFSDRNVPWRQRIESLALELRERLTAHPGAVNLMIGGPMDGPRALALNEHLMETLRDSGLDAGEAARASYLLIVYVFGSIALETAEPGDGLRECRKRRKLPPVWRSSRQSRPPATPSPPKRQRSWPPTSLPSSTDGDFTKYSMGLPEHKRHQAARPQLSPGVLT
jgi:TetR/AcrR family tetracycline transcriptional repressor